MKFKREPSNMFIACQVIAIIALAVMFWISTQPREKLPEYFRLITICFIAITISMSVAYFIQLCEEEDHGS